jgi:hypothetical protein
MEKLDRVYIVLWLGKTWQEILHVFELKEDAELFVRKFSASLSASSPCDLKVIERFIFTSSLKEKNEWNELTQVEDYKSYSEFP